MKALFAVLFVTALAAPALARPIPADGPVTQQPVAAAAPAGEQVAIWYWGVLIGAPKFCWRPETGFYHEPWC